MKFNIQYPIYQVLEDGIREKHRFFLKDKKKPYLVRMESERSGQNFDRTFGMG
jgi:hypothetical protein